MKVKIVTVIILAIIIQEFAIFQNLFGCSAVKITCNGKTIVGNNEDAPNSDVRIWFEPNTIGPYGVAYVGFDNLFPEGGINEAGLVFDAFGLSDKPIKDTLNKEPIFQLELKKMIMENCQTVEEVKDLIDKYNIYFWSHSAWVFLDKSGKYLIVDGDSKILGNNNYFVHTNFRYSEISNENQINCWRYKKAMSLLEKHNEASIDYCKSLMDSVHTNSTLYTTIYDLNNSIIYLYYNHNYKKVIRFNLKEEFKKGKRVLVIPELFPEEKTRNYIGYYNLKSKIDSLLILDKVLESSKIYRIKSELKNIGFLEHILENHGYELLHQNKKQDAIGIFNLFIEYFPKRGEGYDYLGEAYMEDKQYQLALTNYLHSIELDPGNINGKQRINILKKILKK